MQRIVEVKITVCDDVHGMLVMGEALGRVSLPDESEFITEFTGRDAVAGLVDPLLWIAQREYSYKRKKEDKE